MLAPLCGRCIVVLYLVLNLSVYHRYIFKLLVYVIVFENDYVMRNFLYLILVSMVIMYFVTICSFSIVFDVVIYDNSFCFVIQYYYLQGDAKIPVHSPVFVNQLNKKVVKYFTIV